MAFNLREIFEALSDADYVVVGGLAVILHEHLRATRDLDLVIGFAPENVIKVCDALLSAVRRIRCRRVHKRSVMHRFLMHPARFKFDGA